MDPRTPEEVDRDRLAKLVIERVPDRVGHEDLPGRSGPLIPVFKQAAELLVAAGVELRVTVQHGHPEAAALRVNTENVVSARFDRYNQRVTLELVDDIGRRVPGTETVTDVRYDRVNQRWVGEWVDAEARFADPSVTLAMAIIRKLMG